MIAISNVHDEQNNNSYVDILNLKCLSLEDIMCVVIPD